jgi:hypothetical protein
MALPTSLTLFWRHQQNLLQDDRQHWKQIRRLYHRANFYWEEETYLDNNNALFYPNSISFRHPINWQIDLLVPSKFILIGPSIYSLSQYYSSSRSIRTPHQTIYEDTNYRKD